MSVDISFCTTCANRSQQLRATFDQNAAAVRLTPGIEWVILNYGSTDDTHEFMVGQLPALPASIKYARLVGARPWHASVAKNVAHRLGTGECLMNLDCDNLISESPKAIRALRAVGVRAMHLWSGVYGDGTCGRIAVDRELFDGLGGYDEAFFPMGYQDRDLLARLSAAGIPIVRAQDSSGTPVRNTKKESVRLCRRSGFVWKDYDNQNMERSLRNVGAGLLVANAGKAWGCAEVEVYQSVSNQT